MPRMYRKGKFYLQALQARCRRRPTLPPQDVHDRPERAYRDHDNIELNAVADAIAMFVMHDDAPLQCSHFYCSQRGEKEYTRVFVVPQKSFVAWLNDMLF